jgi:hypothetical protein
MKRTIAALALLLAGYAAGAVAPAAHADAGLGDIGRSLQGIHQELTNVRRVLEKIAGKP